MQQRVQRMQEHRISMQMRATDAADAAEVVAAEDAAADTKLMQQRIQNK